MTQCAVHISVLWSRQLPGGAGTRSLPAPFPHPQVCCKEARPSPTTGRGAARFLGVSQDLREVLCVAAWGLVGTSTGAWWAWAGE